ncbi:hypothetical protein ABIE33_004527 [Ensifer sp. 4252]
MGALLEPLRKADGADRTNPDAGAASAAAVHVHLRQKRAAGPGPKTYRLLRTGIAAGLASDIVAGEAAAVDGNDMGKPRRALHHKYRLRTDPCAITAERAFAA